MAKVNITAFQKRIEKQLKQVVSRNNMKQFATLAIELIKDRSRKGLGVENNKLTSFPSLSPLYIAQRRRSRLSPFTTATKSNITFSGRLLASLRVQAEKEGKIVVAPSGTSRNGIPNKRVAEYLVEMDRVFLDLTEQERQKLIMLLKRKIAESSRR